MTFSEFANGLSPYCSGNLDKVQYFNELIGNFIQDAVMDSCPILKKKEDTKYRYLSGKRQIMPNDAQYLYNYRDKKKFSKWIADRTEEFDSYDGVVNWLKSQGINNTVADDACADLLEEIVLSLIGNNEAPDDSEKLSCDLSLIDEIEKKIRQLPRPNDVPVPEKATANETTYIDELLKAYGDAENLPSFSANDLEKYPEYSDDLDDRRIDYYSAVTIQRGVLELGNGKFADQFDVLKREVLDGVKDTARKSHPNGYERMLSVMEQAVALFVPNYLLSSSPYWISGKIKKGVCHHLVNDHKLRWVKKKHE